MGVELLAIKLKNNPHIKGVTFKRGEPIVSQYAGDMFLLIDGKESSLRETLSCFRDFRGASGLKMNSSKTKVLWVGSKKYSNDI